LLLDLPDNRINDDTIDATLTKLHPDHLPPFSLEPHIDQINWLFDGDSVEEIVQRLQSDRSAFAVEQLNIINKMVRSI
jgi:hypothetical protein